MEKYNIPTELSDTSRVWIYQSNRAFTPIEEAEIKDLVKQFANQWISHNQQLKAFADVVYQQFILLSVDESLAGASGCSIDQSVRFMKSIELKYNVNLFDRLQFTYLNDDEVKIAGKSTFKELYQNGAISNQTLVFDNLVDNKSDFHLNWIKPLEKSWHLRMVK